MFGPKEKTFAPEMKKAADDSSHAPAFDIAQPARFEELFWCQRWQQLLHYPAVPLSTAIRVPNSGSYDSPDLLRTKPRVTAWPKECPLWRPVPNTERPARPYPRHRAVDRSSCGRRTPWAIGG